jgi:TetR/AcrR family transcriptional regulator, ethionamide resistance regulator
MASLTRRTEAQTEKRAAIEATVLSATEELLREGRGYAELRVEEITTRAGLSRTAFYFYFRDKRELLVRLTEDVAELLSNEAEVWWSSPESGETEMRGALRRVIDLYREHGVLLRAVVEASAYDEVVAQFWRALLQTFVERSRERMEAEQAAGRMQPVPAGPTAFALVWMTERACYQQLVQGHERLDDEFTEAITEIWLRTVYGWRATSS